MSVELTERFTTFLYEPSRYIETIKYFRKVEPLTATFRFTGLGPDDRFRDIMPADMTLLFSNRIRV